MSSGDQWRQIRSALTGFGGESQSFAIFKTGMPFFDALRLYGAIDLYCGFRECVKISDNGDRWTIASQVRSQRMAGRDVAALRQILGKRKKPDPQRFCDTLRQESTASKRMPAAEDPLMEAPSELDPVLQSGIRGLSAATYDSMNSSSLSACKADLPLSEALQAWAGRERIEQIGDLVFLPIYEGVVDFGRIITPLRARLRVPNPLCAQALMLLSLRSALFAEGFEDRLAAVVYRKKTQKTSFNYSGTITVRGAPVGRIPARLAGRLAAAFRALVSQAWKNNKPGFLAPHAFSTAEWIMQPTPATLSAAITSQEILIRERLRSFLQRDPNIEDTNDDIKELFELSHEQKYDIAYYEAAHKLAKAASSAIYRLWLKSKEPEDKRRKRWYDEAVALRNAPNAISFRHRLLTLIERGKSTDERVGTRTFTEDFDPVQVMRFLGDNRTGRRDFEAFRDCFRMYLVQESGPKRTRTGGANNDVADTEDTQVNNEEEEQL